MEGSSLPPLNHFVTAEGLPKFLSETDLESELSPELAIKEEMIEEVMQELYKEIACTAERAVSPQFQPVSPSFSLSSPAPLFGESGKSESCGASMSDSASSVMAGVRFAGGLLGNVGGKREGEGWEMEEEELMEGCDGVDFGDEWLEKVMGWTPLEVEGEGWT